jgi:hypothetical protein
MYALQKETGIGMSTIRRYWYGTSDGKEHGPRIQVMRIDHMTSIADALGVHFSELFEQDMQTGNHMQLQCAA